MREIRQSGSVGGAAQLNASSLPQSTKNFNVELIIILLELLAYLTA